MKRRLVYIISLILALVLSFALVACGGEQPVAPVTPDGGSGGSGEGGSGGGSETVYTATFNDVKSSAAEIQSAEGIAATVTFTAGSDKTEPMNVVLNMDKRGNTVKLDIKTGEGERATEFSVMVDVYNGYVYKYDKQDEVWEFDSQSYPAGLIDFVSDMEWGETGSQAPAESYTYNNKENTFTLVEDGAKKVNGVLSPAYEVYKNDGSMEDLIDDYLALLKTKLTKTALENAEDPDPMLLAVIAALPKPFTMSNILNTGIKLLTAEVPGGVSPKDMTVGDIISMALGEDGEQQLEQALAGMGIELDADILAQVKARTVGEALEGVIKFVEDNVKASDVEGSIKAIIDKMTGSDDEAAADIISELMGDIFFEEVDTANLKKDLQKYADLIVDVAAGTKFKDVVDGLALPEEYGELAPAVELVKTCIQNGVKLTKLEKSTVITLDKDNKIKSVELALACAHSYDKANTLPLLSDNNYLVKVKAEIKELTAEPAPFDVAIESEPPARITAIVGLDKPETMRIKYDLRTPGTSHVMAASEFEVTFNTLNEGSVAADGALVSYDAQTGEFVFDKKLFEEAAKCEKEILDIYVMADVTEDDEVYGIAQFIIITLADHEPDTVKNYVQGLVDSMGGIDGIIGGMIGGVIGPVD